MDINAAKMPPARWILAAVLLALSVGLPARGEDVKSPATDEGRDFETVTLRGRVVFFAEALERLHGVTSVPEAGERLLALETKQGELIPLVEDTRGRAFRKDARLRGVEMELLGRRYHRVPALQVIKVYRLKEGEKQIVDYWCEICAISTIELKACDCCGGDIELRLRKVKE